MHKITLVCSAHRENGHCNAEELLKILRAIEPETVFEEMLPSQFDLYYAHGSVEAHAIARYRAFKKFESVPVDRYDIAENLLAAIKRDFDRVFDCVARASQEYRLLEEESDERVQENGFRYLNSAAFAQKSERMCEIEDTIVAESGDPDLIRGLEKWRNLIQRREAAMVSNIYDYCRRNVFETGVFLVGAAHKTDIVKKIQECASMEAGLIEWKFTWDERP